MLYIAGSEKLKSNHIFIKLFIASFYKVFSYITTAGRWRKIVDSKRKHAAFLPHTSKWLVVPVNRQKTTENGVPKWRQEY